MTTSRGGPRFLARCCALLPDGNRCPGRTGGYAPCCSDHMSMIMALVTAARSVKL